MHSHAQAQAQTHAIRHAPDVWSSTSPSQPSFFSANPPAAPHHLASSSQRHDSRDTNVSRNSSATSPPATWVDEEEYHLRIGRAIDLLRATMPDFLRTGLTDYDSAPGHPVSSSSSPSRLPRFVLSALLNGGSTSSHAHTASSSSSSSSDASLHLVPVYHPAIKFCIRPMPDTTGAEANDAASQSEAASGAPTPEAAVSFSGRTLYHTSAHVLRHALSALFSDASVALESIRLIRADSGVGGEVGHGAGSASGPLPGIEPRGSGGPSDLSGKPPRSSAATTSRAHSLLLRLRFHGKLRVTHAEHTYNLLFRYDFDPASGQVIKHSVERIEPALGRKLWAGLSAAFLRLAGLAPPPPVPQAAATSAAAAASSVHHDHRHHRRHHHHHPAVVPEPVLAPLPPASHLLHRHPDLLRHHRMRHQGAARDARALHTAGASALGSAMRRGGACRGTPIAGRRALVGVGVAQGHDGCTVSSGALTATAPAPAWGAPSSSSSPLRRFATSSPGRSGEEASSRPARPRALPDDDEKVSSTTTAAAEDQEAGGSAAQGETRGGEGEEEEAATEKVARLQAAEARLSLTFTCAVEDCGHRSTHEFSRRSYERGIVLVQCPGCKNRHLIADHLSWFTESTDRHKTIEEMVASRGGRVRRGVAYSDGRGGETIEIVHDSSEGGVGGSTG